MKHSRSFNFYSIAQKEGNVIEVCEGGRNRVFCVCEIDWKKSLTEHRKLLTMDPGDIGVLLRDQY